MRIRNFVSAALAIGLVSTAATISAGADHDCGGVDASCPDLMYQGLSYPYARAPGSYLFIDGGIYPYAKATENLLGDSTVILPDDSTIAVRDLLQTLGLNDLADEKLMPVVAYGSNPAPSQLSRKYAEQIDNGSVVIPVMKGRLTDYDVVWTPVFVDYGAMPATIAPSPGTEVDIWVTWLPQSGVGTMNSTERVSSGLYALAYLTDVDFAFDGPEPEAIELYISCFGALTLDEDTYAVSGVPAGNRRFKPIDSSEALRLILPTIGWTGSLIELLYANVSDPDGRAERSDMLRPLGRLAHDPHANGMESCAAGSSGAEKPL